MNKEEPKQETLEEDLRKFSPLKYKGEMAYNITDMLEFYKWQQEQNNNLYSILDENYDLNVQFHQEIRESIFSFAVAVYDEKLTFEEWTKKYYGKHIEVAKNLYSEEEVVKLNLSYLQELGKQQSKNGHWINFKEWFNQNKKK